MSGRKFGQKEKEITQNNTQDWHKRYLEQAKWTADLRTYLIEKSKLTSGCKVLDVGCGTGALISEFQVREIDYYGIDLSYRSIHHAYQLFPSSILLQGDGYSLPFDRDIYDFTFCHFLLMWVPEPAEIIREMTRVTKPGGKVIAFAEPDYGGRIDFPDQLTILAKYQIESLKQQGANPYMGRMLAETFQDADLKSIHTGVLGGEWSGNPNWNAWESEWEVFESDLSSLDSHISADEINALKGIDKRAYSKGYRILYVPTFYAMGFVD